MDEMVSGDGGRPIEIVVIGIETFPFFAGRLGSIPIK
jgi:hypothetical protein